MAYGVSVHCIIHMNVKIPRYQELFLAKWLAPKWVCAAVGYCFPKKFNLNRRVWV